MDLWFIFGAIFTIVAVGLGLTWRKIRKPREVTKQRKVLTEQGSRTNGYRDQYGLEDYTESVHSDSAPLIGWLSVGTAALAALFLFLSSFVIITTSHKGVEMFAGKPVGTMSNGWHWKNPIATVVRWDGTVKTYKYSSEEKDDGNAIPILMANGGTAFVNVIYQFRLANNIDQLQRNYPGANLDTINANLVKKEVVQQLGLAYANYNPFAQLEEQQAALLKAVAQGTAPVQVPINPAQTYQAYGQQAFSALRGGLAVQEISLLSLSVFGVTYDGKTQSRIDALNQSIIDTQIALQKEATAKAIAEANSTISKNPPTLAQIQQECVQAYFKALEDGKTPNAGFVCPGTNGPATVVPVS